MNIEPRDFPGRMLACILLGAALFSCRSAPLLEPQADPIHLIEVQTEATGITRGIGSDQMVIQPNENVIWLNSTEDDSVQVEVHGLFETAGSTPSQTCFRMTEDRATSKQVLFPGDAVSLQFSIPGTYTYRVNGKGDTVRGEIVVEEVN